MAFSLFSQSLLAYTLLPEGRGAYAVCVLFGVLVSVMVTPGSDRAAQYFVMARRITVSQGISVSLTICLIGSAIAVGTAIPLIHSNVSFFHNADTSSFYVALTLIPIVSISAATYLQLAGLRRFVRLAMLTILQSAVVLAGISALVWGFGLGVNGAIASLALGHLVVIIFAISDLRQHYNLRLVMPSQQAFRWILGYGLKEYAGRVGMAVDFQLGALVLGFIAGQSEIGLFSAATALLTRVLIVPDSIASYLLPRVAGDRRGLPELVAFCARVTLWTVGCVLLVWVGVSTPLVPIVLSEAFSPIVHLTWIISVGICAQSAAEIMTAYFRGTNRPQVCSWAIWIGLTVNAILLFALQPSFGVVGAAWALTGGLLFRSLFLGFTFYRTTGLIPTSSLILRRGDVRYLWSSGLDLIARRTLKKT